jgi:hypothetical protein
MEITGIDIARNNSDSVAFQFAINNSCIDEMKEILNIGEEYLIPEYQRKQLCLSSEDKLIITSIYERNGIPYLCCYKTR